MNAIASGFSYLFGRPISTVLIGFLALTGLINHSTWKSFKVEDHIRSNGYPVEAHEITTADGYILTYHRIPHGKAPPDPDVSRKPVLLQHGLIESSAAWVLLPTSLGYLLADAGFDVWLGNARGNVYSRKHISLNPDEHKELFWDFSFQEMGYHDLPAAIDYILAKTNHNQLFYTGFSMGTTMFFVLGATRPEYMAKVQAAVLMAPVAHPWHIPSPIVYFLKKLSIFYKPKYFNNMYEFFPHTSVAELFEGKFCEFWLVRKFTLCEDFLKLFVGFHEKNLARVPLKVVVKVIPAGTSYKTFNHFRQILDNDFAQYDYGAEENLKRYGMRRPPPYNLNHVTAPIYIHYGRNDWLSVPEDVMYTARQLPNLRNVQEVPEPLFNHLDFGYSLNNKFLINDVVVKTFVDLSNSYSMRSRSLHHFNQSNRVHSNVNESTEIDQPKTNFVRNETDSTVTI